jgi:hypothetical protein
MCVPFPKSGGTYLSPPTLWPVKTEDADVVIQKRGHGEARNAWQNLPNGIGQQVCPPYMYH